MPHSTLDRGDILMKDAYRHLQEKAPELFGSKLLALRQRAALVRPYSRLYWVEAVVQQAVHTCVIKIPRLAFSSSADQARQMEKARGRFENEFHTTRLLSEQFSGVTNFTIVPALAYFKEIPALVMPAVQGGNIRDLITRRGRWFPRRSSVDELEHACASAGHWLRIFQSGTARRNDQLSIDRMIEYVDIRLQKLVAYNMRGVNHVWRQKVLSLFEQGKHTLANSKLAVAGVHGDFCLSNVLWSRKQAIAIDFSTIQSGSVYYDLTRFDHQLGLFLHKLSFRPSLIARLRTAFLNGYDQQLDNTNTLFTLFTIQHIVCHWLGRLKGTEGTIRERAYNRWVCHHHRYELDRLLANGGSCATS